VDLPLLEANFKRLQRAVHPDMYATKGLQEREASAAASSALNVAYRVLRDPASRAQYLLKLHGIDAVGEGAGSGSVSPQLLMQVMEAREVIADPDARPEDVQGLKERTDAAVRTCVRDVRAAFGAGDLRAAAAITVALQYYGRVLHEATEWLEAHGAKAEQQR
jgi:molecular chaperone HscB